MNTVINLNKVLTYLGKAKRRNLMTLVNYVGAEIGNVNEHAAGRYEIVARFESVMKTLFRRSNEGLVFRKVSDECIVRMVYELGGIYKEVRRIIDESPFEHAVVKMRRDLETSLVWKDNRNLEGLLKMAKTMPHNRVFGAAAKQVIERLIPVHALHDTLLW